MNTVRIGSLPVGQRFTHPIIGEATRVPGETETSAGKFVAAQTAQGVPGFYSVDVEVTPLP